MIPKLRDRSGNIEAQMKNRTADAVIFLSLLKTNLHMTPNSDHQSDSLERYIQRVMEIQNSQNDFLITKDDMDQIAEELHLNDSDKKMIEAEFTGHFERGMGFMKFSNWRSATEELEMALDLKPYHENTLLLLASTYRKWFYETKKVGMRQKALSYARRIIQHNTQNEDAYRIITDLEKKTSPREYTQRERFPVKRKRKKQKKSTGDKIVSLFKVMFLITFWMASGVFYIAKTISKTKKLKAPKRRKRISRYSSRP